MRDRLLSHGSWGNVAAEEEISREEQDAQALRSHQRALAAQDAGLLDREIVPVEIAAKGVTTIVDEDESPAGTRVRKRWLA